MIIPEPINTMSLQVLPLLVADNHVQRMLDGEFGYDVIGQHGGDTCIRPCKHIRQVR